ncbi:hypothetical protein [Mangrovibacillus cuniculi]|uniref:DUF2157 domain-containing protein n=1 Tax=Mangrovibacillus cuniculi TaxID=2593652 RepID=A0A7S8HFY2_9BACI|nr:hypothetical protein [Mangrovibacillus cuniculi]QPC46910.1 hypothetical protein G8O30_08015 [Mangrovibacillus cuniculi]
MTNKDKKHLIINEIRYWQEHQMLPEKYCQYLLTLYSEGEGTGKVKRTKPLLLANTSFYLPAFICISTLLMSLFVLYFTELHFLLQTTILTFFVGALFGVSKIYTKKYWESHIYLLFSTLIFFLLCTNIIVETSLPSSLLSVLIFLTGTLWLWLGRKKKFLLFTMLGIIAIVLMGVNFFIPFATFF